MLLKQKWFRALFRRRMLIAFIIVLQAAFLVYAIASGSMVSRNLGRLLTLLSILAVLSIVSKRDKGAYKTLWVFLILSFPIFGGLLYLLVNFQGTTKRMQKDLQKAKEKAAPLYSLPGNGYDEARSSMRDHFPQVRYLQDFAKFPVYTGTRTKYLPLGEAMLEELLLQLEKAEHFIFLEFFIIQEGKMWNSILEILVWIFRQAGSPEKESRMPQDENAIIALAKRYIEDNIELNPSVADAAAYSYLSSKQLTRIFGKFEGITPGEYIAKRRMAKIEKLILDDSLSLKDISEIMNFSNEYYFNSFFKKHAGMPPGEYRKMY